MISLRNIEKSFATGPTRTWVLRRIDLEVNAGEFVTVMGPSGAGKSTLLAILGMLDAGWTGEFDFLGHAVHGMKPRDRADRQSMVADILDRFHIVGKKDLFPSQLSGGQQQLVGVARAVVARPQLLLADEPTGNLHSGQAREIMELFQQLNQAGTTIIQVTHSEENARYGSRIVRLKDGWLEGEERVGE